VWNEGGKVVIIVELEAAEDKTNMKSGHGGNERRKEREFFVGLYIHPNPSLYASSRASRKEERNDMLFIPLSPLPILYLPKAVHPPVPLSGGAPPLSLAIRNKYSYHESYLHTHHIQSHSHDANYLLILQWVVGWITR
jgi:hypothetical protein